MLINLVVLIYKLANLKDKIGEMTNWKDAFDFESLWPSLMMYFHLNTVLLTDGKFFYETIL